MTTYTTVMMISDSFGFLVILFPSLLRINGLSQCILLSSSKDVLLFWTQDIPPSFYCVYVWWFWSSCLSYTFPSAFAWNAWDKCIKEAWNVLR